MTETAKITKCQCCGGEVEEGCKLCDICTRNYLQMLETQKNMVESLRSQNPRFN